MHSSEALLEIYRTLCPKVEKVYVIPDIEKMSERNSYLALLYQTFFEARQKVKLESSSFLHPRIVFRRLFGEKSILHHHWFEFHNLRGFLNVCWKIFWITLFKIAGGKVVWTLHNRHPHAAAFPHANYFLRKIWSKLPHKIHVHCQTAVEEMSPLLNISKERFFVVPQPDYPVTRMAAPNSRSMLKKAYPEMDITSDIPLFLMFGYIAEYKGVLKVVETFCEISQPFRLIIAGPVKWGNEAYWQKIQIAAKKSPHIYLLGDFIPDDQVHAFFGAANYVLFNFRDILNSAGVLIAKNYGKKMILPNKGCLKELSGEGIYKFENTEELRQQITERLRSGNSAESHH